MPLPRLELTVQYAVGADGLPTRREIRAWCRAALSADGPRGAAITVRFVEEEESRALNRDYRRKDCATNILSFPYETHPRVLGDLAICVPVALREAAAQGKTPTAHLAHLIVHGTLHLQGYDHETDEDAARAMEDKERVILASLGFSDPYLER